MKKVIPTLVAFITGIIVLADFLIYNPLLDQVSNSLLNWALLVAAFAFIVGLLNVLIVHFTRIIKRERGWPYSIVLVLAMWLVIIFGVLDPRGPQGPIVSWVFRYVQYPLQATLFAMLAFFALSAGYRAFRRQTVDATIMLVAASLVFLGQAMLISEWGKWFAAIKDWILSVPTVAGMRGILLGVSLGVIATGLRLLLGMDKPYAD
ncbi:MAG TPA: hypothetical protein ENG33_11225 [Chloroflexi bacterium]|nr:hypothetical protein [Chloroflexota bacterium]